MYRKVLMAYDAAQEGSASLLESDDIENFRDAEIHLLAVMRMPSGLFLGEGFVPEELLEDEKARIQETLDKGTRFLIEQGYNATGHMATGEPVEEICRLASQRQIDLILVGHRKHTSLAARWWKGSMGASLIEYAPCSVLITVSH